MKSIIKSLVELIVAVVAIISSFIFVIGVLIVIFSPIWFPFVIVIYLIQHW
jgi:hypothetical protein